MSNSNCPESNPTAAPACPLPFGCGSRGGWLGALRLLLVGSDLYERVVTALRVSALSDRGPSVLGDVVLRVLVAEGQVDFGRVVIAADVVDRGNLQGEVTAGAGGTEADLALVTGQNLDQVRAARAVSEEDVAIAALEDDALLRLDLGSVGVDERLDGGARLLVSG
ncbi:hypothetical protein [Streptomyces violascens]|uniref:hypothetical protein n=1 Tax=Streptomyces violascens TaxID=67381 RepID=UPI0036582AC0